jgi:sigma-B regulation protein RsbU (phosphoserine phosphatase)
MGGDYYDFIRVDDHHIGFVIADVSGKGVPGSLIMAMVRSAVRAEAPGELSPAKVMQVINRRVYHDTRSNVFITMTYAILNERNHTLRFARAGHEPTICCDGDSGRPVLHTPDGIALGLVEDDPFGIIEEKTLDLTQTSLVVLYTDGVVEAMNGEGEEYGQERFFSVLQRGATAPADSLIDDLLGDIEEFTGGIPQHDDITLIALRRLAPAADSAGNRRGLQTG